MPTWIHDHADLLWGVGALSGVLFVVSLLSLPPLVARIPAEYFAHEQRPKGRMAHLHPSLRLALSVLSNLAGVAFLLVGAVMLVLPGQGILTMFVGFLMIKYPGKYRLERWIVRRELVSRPLNWLRRRSGIPPLLFELGNDRAASGSKPTTEASNPPPTAP
jgi:hypothetical protein